MTDEEILNARPKYNRNGGCNKKPGRKRAKPLKLKPREDKFVQVFLDTGSQSIAKKEAGYSKDYQPLGNKDIAKAVTEKRQELWDKFVENAEEAIQIQLMIMRSDSASYKTRLDATNSVLDRAGLKPAERKEITGADGGAVQVENKVTAEMAQRARMLLVEKGEI